MAIQTDTFSNSLVRALSQLTVTLVILGSINPVFAASKHQATELSPSKSRSATEIAGFGDVKVDPALRQRQERERQQAEQIRQQQLQQRQRQQEIQAQQEAQERYFNSLSPEQQQVYVREQQERQQRQIEAGAKVFLWLMDNSGGGSSSSQTEERYYQNNTSAPTYNSAPAARQEQGGFYGTCHSPMGC